MGTPGQPRQARLKLFRVTSERLKHEGILEGLERGIERGELIGRIQVMQEILGEKMTPRKDLIGNPLAQLNIQPNTPLAYLRAEHQSH
jgi:hypothetical protein